MSERDYTTTAGPDPASGEYLEVDEAHAFPLLCGDCHRPTYYDYADEAYHHAANASEGCFLIGPEDRPDDLAHPSFDAGDEARVGSRVIRRPGRRVGTVVGIGDEAEVVIAWDYTSRGQVERLPIAKLRRMVRR